MFVLPDFGRDSDETPGGNDFNTIARRCAFPTTGCWPWARYPRHVLAIAGYSMDLVPTLAVLWIFSRFAQADPLRSSSDLAMQPVTTAAEHFVAYPPLARSRHTRIDVLRRLPLIFVLCCWAGIAYDSKFPAERQEVDAQFRSCARLAAAPQEVMSRFERLSLARELEEVDWSPAGEFSSGCPRPLDDQSVSPTFARRLWVLNEVRAAIPPPQRLCRV